MDRSENGRLVPVSEYVSLLKRHIEAHGRCWIVGELSQHSARGGHWYFSIKDEFALLNCVMWRSYSSRVDFLPEPGLRVKLFGGPSVYSKRGHLQFDVRRMELLPGDGDLQAAFEALKAELAAKGWFDPEHKKPLPRYPHLIGIVTSSQGAAYQDMLRILGERFPVSGIGTYSVRVQGVAAAPEIADAVRKLNLLKGVRRPDVIILGRGGGSLEDLWAFNELEVAEAIFDSEIPVISGVGHESDTTISDLVADVRASTPSHAAQIAVPDSGELRRTAIYWGHQLHTQLRHRLDALRQQVRQIAGSYEFNTPVHRVRESSQELGDLLDAIHSRMREQMQERRHAVDSMRQRIEVLDPQRGLRQGLVRVERGGVPVPNGLWLSRGDHVELYFVDCKRNATIDS